MSKLKIAGWVAWIFGALLLGYQAIALFMGTKEKFAWENLALVDIVEKNHLLWIDNIPWENVQADCWVSGSYATVSIAVLLWTFMLYNQRFQFKILSQSR